MRKKVFSPEVEIYTPVNSPVAECPPGEEFISCYTDWDLNPGSNIIIEALDGFNNQPRQYFISRNDLISRLYFSGEVVNQVIEREEVPMNVIEVLQYNRDFMEVFMLVDGKYYLMELVVDDFEKYTFGRCALNSCYGNEGQLTKLRIYAMREVIMENEVNS